jgi:hypothetical protein
MVQPDRPLRTIWRMCFACWITKATDTHSKHVIFIAFPRQQWLRERASELRLYEHCSYCWMSDVVKQLQRNRILVTLSFMYTTRLGNIVNLNLWMNMLVWLCRSRAREENTDHVIWRRNDSGFKIDQLTFIFHNCSVFIVQTLHSVSVLFEIPGWFRECLSEISNAK